MLQHLVFLLVGIVIGGGATWYRLHVQPPDLTTFTGKPKQVDADTIDFGAVRLRLHGIDAPNARGGKCTKDGKPWDCYKASNEAMAEFIGDRDVTCVWTGKRAQGRAVAICHVAGVSLNEWLVRQGWAVAFAHFSGDYIEAEDEARSKGRGLWQPGVRPPAKWWQRYHARPRYAGAT